MLLRVNQRDSFFKSGQSFFFDGTLVLEHGKRASLGAQRVLADDCELSLVYERT